MTDEKWNWQSERWIPSDAAAGRKIIDEVLTQLKHHQWAEPDVFAVHLALDEALVNAIKHGNREDHTKRVRISCRMSRQRIRIEIADEGPGFNPTTVPDCTRDENLEVPSGRGLMLMKSFMSHVQYNAVGNCVVMEKVRAD